VTHLNNTYIVYCESLSVCLYSTDTHRPLNVINVDGMNNPLDIVICRDDRQLFIANWDFITEERCIWRVSIDDQSCVNWLTTDEPFDCYTLSLTSRRLLVTLWEPARLHQYNSTDGQLQRVVSMPQYMRYLWHGVETTRGTFVVGHRGTPEDKEQDAVSELFRFVSYQHVFQQ